MSSGLIAWFEHCRDGFERVAFDPVVDVVRVLPAAGFSQFDELVTGGAGIVVDFPDFVVWLEGIRGLLVVAEVTPGLGSFQVLAVVWDENRSRFVTIHLVYAQSTAPIFRQCIYASPASGSLGTILQ